MLSIITDENNDLQLDSVGNIKMDTGAEAYRQHLINRIRLQQYEYPYDLTRGINWLGYVFGNSVNLAMWESQLLELVSRVSFVKTIVDWRYEIESTNLQFKLVVDTDYGEIELKG